MRAIMLTTYIATFLFLTACAWGHDDGAVQHGGTTTNIGLVQVQSLPGENAWNAGKAPADWWAEIRRQHGHVGPWNIIGWRIGQAALRELGSEWGRHELDVVCYVPLQTPFTCLADGLAVGTGNSIGRLDLRLAEVFIREEIFIAIRRKDQKGSVLEFRPNPQYLKSITNRPVKELERISRACAALDEAKIFTICKVQN